MFDFSGEQFNDIRNALEYVFSDVVYEDGENIYKDFMIKKEYYFFKICKHCGFNYGHHKGNDRCRDKDDNDLEFFFEEDKDLTKKFFIFVRLLL